MTKKEATSSSSSSTAKGDYLGDHFSDVRRGAADQRGPVGERREDADNLTMAQKVVRQQKNLEKLLLHADKDNISMLLFYIRLIIMIRIMNHILFLKFLNQASFLKGIK